MVNVFGESAGNGPEGNPQVMKKVITTVDRFGDYIAEIDQSYVLGFTPYRLHTNVDGTFVTPIRAYDSKLIYFVEADDGGGVGLQGDRGPSGVKGLKGDSGDQGPSGSQGPAGKENVVLYGLEVFLERLVKLDSRTYWK